MSAAVIRCKMQVEQVTRDINSDGTTRSETVRLRAVYEGSPENKEWAKYTPSATFAIQIDNPGAQGKLTPGHEFYVDFTPAEAQP